MNEFVWHQLGENLIHYSTLNLNVIHSSLSTSTGQTCHGYCLMTHFTQQMTQKLTIQKLTSPKGTVIHTVPSGLVSMDYLRIIASSVFYQTDEKAIIRKHCTRRKNDNTNNISNIWTIKGYW